MNERKMRKIVQDELEQQEKKKKREEKPPVWFDIALIAFVLWLIFGTNIGRFVVISAIIVVIIYIVVQLITYFKKR